MILGAVLLGNSVATQVSDVVAVSGFLSQVGVTQLIAVWAVDYTIVIVFSGFESLIVDRFDRRRLIGWVSLAFCLLFAGLRIGFAVGAPLWLTYGLLYVMGDQQLLFFPLVFWVLAEDSCMLPEAKAAFPIISSWGFVGKLAGIAIAAVAPEVLPLIGLGLVDVLVVNAAIYAAIWLVSRAKLAKFEVHYQTFRHEATREALADGWQFVRKVPSFRFLAMAIVALVACDAIIEFRFYAVSSQFFSTTARYEEFYSAYRFVFLLAALLVEGLLVRRLLARFDLKNAFMFQPIGALLGSLWMIVMPGLPSAIGGMVLQKLPQGTIDETARKDLETLVPPDRRGRVSILLDSYVYAGGSVLGCAILGLVVGLQMFFGQADLFYVSLAAAAAAAAFSLWCALGIRRVYDSSLLSAGFARRKRTSDVLNKLSF